MERLGYYCANSVEETINLLKDAKSQGIILAGGTDIMVRLNAAEISDEAVFIGIENISELKNITVENGVVKIGSLVTAKQLHESKIIKDNAKALYIAAIESASPQVRNRATIGGNVGTASPSGDLVAALIALDAQAIIAGDSGERTVPVSEIAVGVKKNCLSSTELITEFVIPIAEKNTSSDFQKLGKRKAMTISIVNVATKVTLEDDLITIKDIRIAVGACSTKIIRLKKLEETLISQKVEKNVLDKFKEYVLDEISPITDIRSTQWYRKETAQVLTVRSILQAADSVRKGLEV